MKNFVQPGNALSFAAPYAVASGDGMLIGSLFAIASSAAANGAAVEGSLTGVFDVTALSSDTFAVGAKVYWDNTNKRCTSTAAGNSLIGAATAVKVASTTTVRVRLDGTSV